MILRPLRSLPLKRTTVFLFLITIIQNVNGKPQDTGIFEQVASQGIAMVGNAAEMVQNAGMISKNSNFDWGFVKVKSEAKVGTGSALRNELDDDSDDSSEEERRKRSIDYQLKENTLIGEELLLPLTSTHQQQHLHRNKRAPCHTYGGGGGGSGTGGGTGAGDAQTGDDEIDLERRRRAYAARRRKAAAQKAKSKKTANDSRKKKLINDDDETKPTVTRRKRQTEVDDLNQTTENEGNNLAKYAQQVADKIHNAFNSFVQSVNEMAERVKQHFTKDNTTNSTQISEI